MYPHGYLYLHLHLHLYIDAYLEGCKATAPCVSGELNMTFLPPARILQDQQFYM